MEELLIPEEHIEDIKEIAGILSNLSKEDRIILMASANVLKARYELERIKNKK